MSRVRWYRYAGRLAVEIVRAADPVRVHNRVPTGPGAHPVVHEHRTVGGGTQRWRAVRGRVVFVVHVVRHHEVVQGVRRTESGRAVVLVRRILRRRVRLRSGSRARDQRQEPRTDPRRTHRRLRWSTRIEMNRVFIMCVRGECTCDFDCSKKICAPAHTTIRRLS